MRRLFAIGVITSAIWVLTIGVHTQAPPVAPQLSQKSPSNPVPPQQPGAPGPVRPPINPVPPEPPQPGGVLRLIVGEGIKLVMIGIGIGLLGGLAIGRALSSLVYGIPVRDPLTFAGVALQLTMVALAACVIPARRAARVDPMVTLRYE